MVARIRFAAPSLGVVLIVVGLGAVMASACSAPDDEHVAPTSVVAAAGAPVAGFPQADPAVSLDPLTSAECDSVGGFALDSYTAHVSTDRSAAFVERLNAELDRYEPQVIEKVPELADEARLLGTRAREVLAAPPSPAASLSPDVVAANHTVLAFLRDTCKYRS